MMKHSQTKQNKQNHNRGWMLFVLAQLLLVSTVTFAAVVRDRQWKLAQALPELRAHPRTISPRYNRPEVVSTEQLQAVLLKLRPQLTGKQPKVNHVDHALRCWGVEANFSEPQFLSGESMRKLLTDHRQFAQDWGTAARPLLIDTLSGVQVRTREGNATASHTDHTLAGLGEVGTPLDFPIHTINRETTLSALVQSSLASFSLNQGEYEWSTLIQAMYLKQLDGWRTKEGQQVDFNQLSDRLMREAPRQGVCFGNHRLYTLAALLQIDEQEQLLIPAMRKQVIQHLQAMTTALVQHQHAYGYWDGNWASKPATSGDELTETGNRILATGHALEWWAIAPPEVLPPRETLVRAGQWLTHAIDGLDKENVKQNYTYLTHAGRALALWRKTTPAQAIASINSIKEVTKSN